MEHAIRKTNIILLHMSVNAKHTLALSYPTVNDVQNQPFTPTMKEVFGLLSPQFTVRNTTEHVSCPRQLETTPCYTDETR